MLIAKAGLSISSSSRSSGTGSGTKSSNSKYVSEIILETGAFSGIDQICNQKQPECNLYPP